MKFLCIRNYFIGSSTRTRWTKGKYYEGRIPTKIEKENGIAFYIKSNNKIEYLVKIKDYSNYFKSIEDVRDEKLEELLKNL